MMPPKDVIDKLEKAFKEQTFDEVREITEAAWNRLKEQMLSKLKG